MASEGIYLSRLPKYKKSRKSLVNFLGFMYNFCFRFYSRQDYSRTESLLWPIFLFFPDMTAELKLCDNQAHSLYLPDMHSSTFSGIDTGGVQTAVAQNIS